MINIKDIIKNTINSVTNFSEEYKKNLVKTELELYGGDTDYKFIDIIQVHSIALISYLKDNNSCFYIGIAMLFISLLIYMFNIIRE